MSNIGNKKILIPDSVSVIYKNNIIKIQGPFGFLERKINNLVTLIFKNNFIEIIRINNLKVTRAYHGLIRSLIQNMIFGVKNQYCKIIIIEGIGYKFQLVNNILNLFVGFTHSINIKIPKNIIIKLENFNKLIIYSIDKELLTLFIDKIRSIKPPEPYNGKGILFFNEIIKKKEGKKRK